MPNRISNCLREVEILQALESAGSEMEVFIVASSIALASSLSV